MTPIQRVRTTASILAMIIYGWLNADAQLLPQYIQQHQEQSANKEASIGKVLYIGDSMTGWLAERMNAYGAENGFEVATVVWDGSTIRKWGDSAKLKSIISRENPDAVFISLGLNELLEPNPEGRLESAVDNILSAVGDRKLVWIGPPSWPGRGNGDRLIAWLSDKLGSNRFFNSSSLSLQRQGKNNPHPTREAVIQWTDSIVSWIRQNPTLNFTSFDKPVKKQMLRSRSYKYIRMKEKL